MPPVRAGAEPVEPITFTNQLAFRVDRDAVARLDALARRLCRPGLVVTRSDALRVALHVGLDALARELDPERSVSMPASKIRRANTANATTSTRAIPDRAPEEAHCPEPALVAVEATPEPEIVPEPEPVVVQVTVAEPVAVEPPPPAPQVVSVKLQPPAPRESKRQQAESAPAVDLAALVKPVIDPRQMRLPGCEG
jgi:hypothetical protein